MVRPLHRTRARFAARFLIVGLLLGLLLIRVDLAFTGKRGRRARIAEEATAIRPEPARIEPLL